MSKRKNRHSKRGPKAPLVPVQPFQCRACLDYSNPHPGRACFLPSAIVHHQSEAAYARRIVEIVCNLTTRVVTTEYHGQFPTYQSVREWRKANTSTPVEPWERTGTCDACGDPDVVGLEFDLPDEGITFMCDPCILRRFAPDLTSSVGSDTV